MVKTPKMRHSKSQRDPVTIELGPEEVSRVEKENAKGDAGRSAGDKDAARKEPARGAEATAAKAANADAKASGSKTAEAKPSRGASESTSAGSNEPGRRPEKSPDGDGGANSGGGAQEARPLANARGGTGAAVIGGIVGAVIVLLAGGGLQYAGLLPSPGGSADSDAAVADSLETEIVGLKKQIAGLKESADAAGSATLKQALDASTKRVEGLSATVAQLGSDFAGLKNAAEAGGGGESDAALQRLDARIEALQSTVASIGPEGGAVSQSDIEALNRKIAGMENEIGAAGDAATAIDSRLAALEKDVASLSARVDARSDRPRVALAIAASALKAAIDRGGAFAAEVETFAAVAPDAPELPELRALAEDGVPARARIVATVAQAAEKIVAAAHPVDQNAGFFERLWSSAGSLVTVRPVGFAEGDTVPAIVARMEAAVKSGDLAGALKEYETLPEAPKAAGADFAEKLRTRLKLEQLVDKALAGALKAT